MKSLCECEEPCVTAVDGTSLIVVLRLGDRGEKQSVWVIYDFHEKDDESDNREQEHMITVDSDGKLLLELDACTRAATRSLPLPKLPTVSRSLRRTPRER